MILFDKIIEKKLNEPLSDKYNIALKRLSVTLRVVVSKYNTIPIEFIEDFLSNYSNNTSYNTMRRHLYVLINALKHGGFKMEEIVIKSRKQTEQLHKPINNLAEVFAELKGFNHNLYLCCLLTYGCLLRPRREIRMLKWGNFSNDLSHISIDGSRVKSKRNRIVPVPDYVKNELTRKDSEWNIFSHSPIEFNNDYFKTLWGRFKRVSETIGENGYTLFF